MLEIIKKIIAREDKSENFMFFISYINTKIYDWDLDIINPKFKHVGMQKFYFETFSYFFYF